MVRASDRYSSETYAKGHLGYQLRQCPKGLGEGLRAVPDPGQGVEAEPSLPPSPGGLTRHMGD